MSKKYIEKERALQLLEENASDDEVYFAVRAIEAEPPADVKPVARGYLVYSAGHHWEEDGTDYPDLCVYVKGRCSECGKVLCRAGETTIHYPDELMYTDKEWDYRKELIEAEDKLLDAATQRKVSVVNFCPNCGVEMRGEKDE